MTAQEESLADKGTSDNTEDLYKWANGLLLHSLAGMPVIPHGGDVRASFVAPELNSELQFYGDIFGCRPTRTVTFEVRVVMHYVGKVFLGDACMGELRGYINVPKIRHDTMNEDFEVVVHGYELSPQGHIERNLCPAEHSILEGIKSIR